MALQSRQCARTPVLADLAGCLRSDHGRAQTAAEVPEAALRPLSVPRRLRRQHTRARVFNRGSLGGGPGLLPERCRARPGRSGAEVVLTPYRKRAHARSDHLDTRYSRGAAAPVRRTKVGSGRRGRGSRTLPPALCRMSRRRPSRRLGPALLPESLQRLKRADAAATLPRVGRRRRCRAGKSSIRAKSRRWPI